MSKKNQPVKPIQINYFRVACKGYLEVNAGESIKNSPPASLAEDLMRFDNPVLVAELAK